jgi:hypothetical protein
MFNQKHQLNDEFPEHHETIQRLKQSDPHFAKLAAQYYTLAEELHKIDEQIETPSDDYTEQKKKERLALKDQLIALIHKAA